MRFNKNTSRQNTFSVVHTKTTAKGNLCFIDLLELLWKKYLPRKERSDRLRGFSRFQWCFFDLRNYLWLKYLKIRFYIQVTEINLHEAPSTTNLPKQAYVQKTAFIKYCKMSANISKNLRLKIILNTF